ncbi:MAG: prepilin peptidase [Planctomycetota bacterium]|nr:prepilin peptidase [Planctomycetota bacterium]
MISYPIVLLFSGLLGGIVGSFLNVCIYRIPIDGLRVSHPRGSFCPSCKAPVRWFDNVPVLAWMWLRGRCRDCSNPISPRYPLVEAFSAAIFLLIAVRLGGQFEEVIDFFTVLVLWIWVSTLIVVSGIDLDHRIIPDRITIPGTALVLLLSPWFSWLTESGYVFTIDPSSVTLDLKNPQIWIAVAGGVALIGGGFHRFVPNWQQQRRGFSDSLLAYVVGGLLGLLLAASMIDPSLLAVSPLHRIVLSLGGAAVGSGCIWGIGWIGSVIFRKPAMGFGDVKWMGFLGATLGPVEVLIAFLIACVLGSVVGIWLWKVKGSRYIPFGPFLAAGAASMLLARPELEWIWNRYTQLLQG